MYEDVGISKQHAIQKVHRILNEEVRHGSMSALQAHQSGNLNAAKSSTELTPKFLDVFRDTYSAPRQYALLQLQKQLRTIKKKDREWLGSQAAVLQQICKVIVDSAR